LRVGEPPAEPEGREAVARARRTESPWACRCGGVAGARLGAALGGHPSNAVRVVSSRGTVRSVPSLPRGTFSQLPWLAKSSRQSNRVRAVRPGHTGARRMVRPWRANGSGEDRRGGHQVAVVIGGERTGQRPIQPWDVPGVQQPGRRSFGPAPDREVIEERAQVDHGPCWTPTPATGRSRATRPARVDGGCSSGTLPVGAVQLRQPDAPRGARRRGTRRTRSGCPRANARVPGRSRAAPARGSANATLADLRLRNVRGE